MQAAALLLACQLSNISESNEAFGHLARDAAGTTVYMPGILPPGVYASVLRLLRLHARRCRGSRQFLPWLCLWSHVLFTPFQQLLQTKQLFGVTWNAVHTSNASSSSSSIDEDIEDDMCVDPGNVIILSSLLLSSLATCCLHQYGYVPAALRRILLLLHQCGRLPRLSDLFNRAIIDSSPLLSTPLLAAPHLSPAGQTEEEHAGFIRKYRVTGKKTVADLRSRTVAVSSAFPEASPPLSSPLSPLLSLPANNPNTTPALLLAIQCLPLFHNGSPSPVQLQDVFEAVLSVLKLPLQAALSFTLFHVLLQLVAQADDTTAVTATTLILQLANKCVCGDGMVYGALYALHVFQTRKHTSGETTALIPAALRLATTLQTSNAATGVDKPRNGAVSIPAFLFALSSPLLPPPLPSPLATILQLVAVCRSLAESIPSAPHFTSNTELIQHIRSMKGDIAALSSPLLSAAPQSFASTASPVSALEDVGPLCQAFLMSCSLLEAHSDRHPIIRRAGSVCSLSSMASDNMEEHAFMSPLASPALSLPQVPSPRASPPHNSIASLPQQLGGLFGLLGTRLLLRYEAAMDSIPDAVGMKQQEDASIACAHLLLRLNCVITRCCMAVAQRAVQQHANLRGALLQGVSDIFRTVVHVERETMALLPEEERKGVASQILKEMLAVQHHGTAALLHRVLAHVDVLPHDVLWGLHLSPCLTIVVRTALESLALPTGTMLPFVARMLTKASDVHNSRVSAALSSILASGNQMLGGLKSRAQHANVAQVPEAAMHMLALAADVAASGALIPVCDALLLASGYDASIRSLSETGPRHVTTALTLRTLAHIANTKQELWSMTPEDTRAVHFAQVRASEDHVGQLVTASVMAGQWDTAMEALGQLFSCYDVIATKFSFEIGSVSRLDETPADMSAILMHAPSHPAVAPVATAGQSFAGTIPLHPDLKKSSLQAEREAVQWYTRSHALFTRALRYAVELCALDNAVEMHAEKHAAAQLFHSMLRQAERHHHSSPLLTSLSLLIPLLMVQPAERTLPARSFALVASGPSFGDTPKWFLYESRDEDAADVVISRLREDFPFALVHGPDAPVAVAAIATRLHWVGAGSASVNVYEEDVEKEGSGLKCETDHIHVLPCYPQLVQGEEGPQELEYFGWFARSRTVSLSSDATAVFVHAIGLFGPCLSKDKFHIARSNPEVLIQEADSSALVRFSLIPDKVHVPGCSGWLGPCCSASLKSLQPEALGDALLQWVRMACMRVYDTLTWVKSVVPAARKDVPPSTVDVTEEVSDLLGSDVQFDDGPSLGAGSTQTTMLEAATAVRNVLTTSQSFFASQGTGTDRSRGVRQLDVLSEVDEGDDFASVTSMDDAARDATVMSGTQAAKMGLTSPSKLVRQPTLRQLAAAVSTEHDEAHGLQGVTPEITPSGVVPRAGAHLLPTAASGRHLASKDFKPNIDPSGVHPLVDWMEAPSRQVETVPLKYQGALLSLPLRASPYVRSSIVERCVYALLTDTLSSTWAFCTGPRTIRQLLADYAELKSTWCERIVTEKRREWIREEAAREEKRKERGGERGGEEREGEAGEEMPDFAQLINRNPSDTIVQLQRKFIELHDLTATLAGVYRSELHDTADELLHVINDSLSSIFSGFEALSQL
jgi:hypothetical protein